MKPERVIALLAGESGTGKSFWIAQLKKALIFDTDIGGGLSYLSERIARNGSELIQAGSYLDVMREIANRRSKLSNYTTIAIDHLTTLHQESILRHNPEGKEDFGKSYDKASREWRRIRELVRAGDFNLVCTAHLKGKYERKGSQAELVGTTTDASKNIEADMMIVLYLQKSPDGRWPSTAKVVKWRRDPEDARGVIPASFPFTPEEFIRLHGFSMDGSPREEKKPFSSPAAAAARNSLQSARDIGELRDAWAKIAAAETEGRFSEADFVELEALKNELKDKLANPPTIAQEPLPHPNAPEFASIGKDACKAILGLMEKLKITWDEIRSDRGAGAGLSLVAWFTPSDTLRLTDLGAAQGHKLYSELSRRAKEAGK